jgi:hypothetical protein
MLVASWRKDLPFTFGSNFGPWNFHDVRYANPPQLANLPCACILVGEPRRMNQMQARLIASSHLGHLELRSPLTINAQAVLAILFASAMAATFVGRRPNNAASQGRCLVPWILAYRMTASAPVVNKLRR